MLVLKNKVIGRTHVAIEPLLVLLLGGLPFSTGMHLGGRGGWVKSPIHFHCVLHAKRGQGGPDSM